MIYTYQLVISWLSYHPYMVMCLTKNNNIKRHSAENTVSCQIGRH